MYHYRISTKTESEMIAVRIDTAKIQALRKQRGFTQKDVAVALGYESAAAWCRIESGVRNLKANKIPILAELLGVEISELYTDSLNEKMGCA